ncbi:MAG: GrpB family protein [Thermomicrobiales bacterium]
MIGSYRQIMYGDPADAFRPYDPRCPGIARRVEELIQTGLPGVPVEHVGSTAIPGCAGKGVVDRMLTYAPGQLDVVRAGVEALGFQLHLGIDPFPPTRPVYVGAWTEADEAFRLHLHLIPAGDPEVEAQRRFRDALRADPRLVADYVANKRAALFAGATDAVAYNRGKAHFISGVIGDRS